MFEDLKAAFDKKELSTLESGAMCYMTSKRGYLSDRDGHWHPHLMIFVPETNAPTWAPICRAPRLSKLKILRIA
jgi:hypothetical protein